MPKAPFGAGSTGGKSGVTAAHYSAKTGAHTARLDYALRGPLVSQFMDAVALKDVAAVRVQATYAHLFAKGALSDSFDPAGCREMRVAINGFVGDTRARIRAAARNMDMARYETAHQLVAALAPPPVLALPADPYWRPNDASFWPEAKETTGRGQQGQPTRPGVVNGPLSRGVAVAHRCLHEVRKLESSRRCILDCMMCPIAEEHSRRGHLSSGNASDMASCCRGRCEPCFGGVSAWDVFHGDRQLPTHPFGGPQQAGQGAAGGAARSLVQHGAAALPRL